MLNQWQSLSHESRSVHDVEGPVSHPCDIFEGVKESLGGISTSECLAILVSEDRLWSRTYTVAYWYHTINPITKKYGLGYLGLSSAMPLAHVFALEYTLAAFHRRPQWRGWRREVVSLYMRCIKRIGLRNYNDLRPRALGPAPGNEARYC